MNGPTMVPCRVMHASTAAALLLIRFITLSSWPTMSSASLSQSASDSMKNVVLPESPYGVCTTRSVPRPCAVGQRGQLGVGVRPAEHVRHRRRTGLVAELGGHDLRVEPPAQRVRRAGSARSRARGRSPRSPRRRRPSRPSASRRGGCRYCLHLGVAQQVVVDLLAGLELHVRLVLRGEHPRVLAVPGVVVDDVLEVAHPAVDAEQVERGRADEVDRLLVGPEERADLGDAAQRAAGGGRGVLVRGPDWDLRVTAAADVAEPPMLLRLDEVAAPVDDAAADRSDRGAAARADAADAGQAGDDPGQPAPVPARSRPASTAPTASQASSVSCMSARVLRVGPGGQLDADGAGAPADVDHLPVDARGRAARRRARRAGTRTGCGTSRPGTPARPGRPRNAERTSASTAQALRSQPARQRPGPGRRRRCTAPPSSSSWPNRARSRAVAHSPPSWIAVPMPSQMISASCSAPIGAHTRSEIRSAIRGPAARSQTQPEDVGLGRAVEEPPPCSAPSTQRAQEA